jgi:hypothetical protein
MINEHAYESSEEYNEKYAKAKIAIEKLYLELGFVVFDVAHDMINTRKGKRRIINGGDSR